MAGFALYAEAHPPALAEWQRADWWRNTSTLDLDFYNDRYYMNGTTYNSVSSFILASSATFTRAGTSVTNTTSPFYLSATQIFISRASTASYYDSSGVLQTAAGVNTARNDYDPVSHTLNGILVEPSVTNLITQSSDLSTWTTNGTFTLNNTTSAPDGSTAYSVSSSAANAGKSTTFTSTINSTYTLSVYIKNVSGNASVNIGSTSTCWTGGNTATATVDASTCSVTSSSAGVSSTSAQNIGNGWCRAVIVAARNASACTPTITNYNASASASENAFWGNQVEKASTVSSYIPTSGSTVTRSADIYANPRGGTYFDVSGVLQLAAPNVPRFDYDPVTHERLGLLIESSRTNSIANSNSWTGTNATVAASATTAPDGTVTGVLLYEDSTNNTHYTGQAVTITANRIYTYSAFLKAKERTQVNFCGGKAGSPYTRACIIVNLSNGSFTNNDYNAPVSVTQRVVQALANGWYRVSLSTIPDTTSTDGLLQISLYNGSSDTYAGDGSSGIYIWGAQIEDYDGVTSYIPTSGSTITRPFDNFQIPMAAWSTTGQGTVITNNRMDFQKSTTGQLSGVVAVNDGTSSNAFHVFHGNSQQYTYSTTCEVYLSNVNNPCSLSQNFTPGTWASFALAYASSDERAAFNGNLGAAQTAALPTMTNLVIGNARQMTTTQGLNGWMRRVTYLPTREPNVSIQDYTR